jgi:hypothetical protein
MRAEWPSLCCESPRKSEMYLASLPRRLLLGVSQLMRTLQCAWCLGLCLCSGWDAYVCVVAGFMRSPAAGVVGLCAESACTTCGYTFRAYAQVNYVCLGGCSAACFAFVCTQGAQGTVSCGMHDASSRGLAWLFQDLRCRCGQAKLGQHVWCLPVAHTIEVLPFAVALRTAHFCIFTHCRRSSATCCWVRACAT